MRLSPPCVLLSSLPFVVSSFAFAAVRRLLRRRSSPSALLRRRSSPSASPFVALCVAVRCPLRRRSLPSALPFAAFCLAVRCLLRRRSLPFASPFVAFCLAVRCLSLFSLLFIGLRCPRSSLLFVVCRRRCPSLPRVGAFVSFGVVPLPSVCSRRCCSFRTLVATAVGASQMDNQQNKCPTRNAENSEPQAQAGLPRRCSGTRMDETIS